MMSYHPEVQRWVQEEQEVQEVQEVKEELDPEIEDRPDTIVKPCSSFTIHNASLISS